MNISPARTNPLWLLLLVIGLLAPWPAEAQIDAQHKPPAKQEAPEAFVQRLYQHHRTAAENTYWLADPQALPVYFTAELTKLFLEDDACKTREQGLCNLDFDPLLDAQDFDPQLYNTLEAVTIHTAAPVQVSVHFSNMGTKKTLTYVLSNTPQGWRVSNILYPDHLSLTELLSGGSIVNFQSHKPGIWSIAGTEAETRWLIIQNLDEAQSTGIYHIEVIARKNGAAVWDIRHLADHMAITVDALTRSVDKPLAKGLVYPESFTEAFKRWKNENNGKGGTICTQSVQDCLESRAKTG